MALNDQAYDSSDGGEDSWELIDDDDETTPLSALQNNGATCPTAAVPENYTGEVTEINAEREFQRLDADAPDRAGDGEEMGESFATAVSTITAGDRQEHKIHNGGAKEGEGDANDVQEGKDSLALKEEEQEDAPAAYHDEKLVPKKAEAAVADNRPQVAPAKYAWGCDKGQKDEETCDVTFDPASAPIAPDNRPPKAAPEKYACTTKPSAPPLTDDENTEESISTVEPEKDLNEKAASVSDPVANLEEKTGGEKSEVSVLVDSLLNMGFEKGLVEKTIQDLRLAGAKKIDHESVIDGMATDDSPEEDEEKSENSKLFESLTNMGFEREHIEQAIEVLYQEGAKEIDEDAVIEEIERKKNDDSRLWDPFVEFSAQDLRLQNRLLRRRTRRAARGVGLSARELWTNVRGESARFRADLKARCNEADLPERTARAAAEIRHAATSAGDAICRANEEYRITETLATAAVVGGAALLALGNPRAGVGVIAAAGATLAAGEAMKKSSARSGSTYTRDYGLGEGMHID